MSRIYSEKEKIQLVESYLETDSSQLTLKEFEQDFEIFCLKNNVKLSELNQIKEYFYKMVLGL